MAQDGPRLTPDLIEDAVGRLIEAIAVLEVVEEGQMLSELPARIGARRRHQAAVSLLAVLRRDLIDLCRDLRAAETANRAIARATARDASKPG